MKKIFKRSAVFSIFIVLLGLITVSAFGTTATTWTVSHGATGILELNLDGSYYSTCAPLKEYPYSLCPSQSGKYARGTGGNAQYMYFYGEDHRTIAYRIGGSVTSPDSLTQITNSKYYNGVIIRKSESFVCTEFYDSVYNFSRGPIGFNCTNNMICLRGSNDLLGVISQKYVLISEITAGYFIIGKCK
ncbi:MAG: hypothetical protein ACXVCQ_19275 [Bacteriovorax sp.]